MDQLDSPAYKRTGMATTFLRICALSVLWLLFSLPLITFGPATMAAYHCAVKVIRRDRSKLLKEFTKAFRENLKAGMIVGTAALLVAALLVLGVRVASVMSADSSLWAALSYVYFFLLVLLGCCVMFVFPVFSRFRMSVKQGLKLGLVSAFRHLFTAITCLLVWILAAQIFRFLPAMGIVLPGCCFVVCSLVIEPVLKSYTVASDGEDAWYLE